MASLLNIYISSLTKSNLIALPHIEDKYQRALIFQVTQILKLMEPKKEKKKHTHNFQKAPNTNNFSRVSEQPNSSPINAY